MNVEKAVDNLRIAIIKQAVKDYADAYFDYDRESDRLRDCEKFFESEWYETLSQGLVDGKTMMKRAIERSVA